MFRSTRVRSALASCLAHVVLGALVLFIGRPSVGHTQAATARTAPVNSKLVWLIDAGRPAGGGGGGARQISRPRAVAVPGTDRSNVPVSPPPSLDQARLVDANPIEAPVLAAVNMAAAPELHAGVIEETPPAGDAAGFGARGLAGTGDGGGLGDGRGRGLGPGAIRGTGDGVFELGNGVTAPTLLYSVAPRYTSEATRARIEGRVLLECVVLADGTIDTVRVLRSLDRRYGLDQEAISAARAWRFVPGSHHGRAVAVRITIEMSFTLR
jgi:protein TonB